MSSKPHTDSVYKQKKIIKGDFKFHISLSPIQKPLIEYIESNKITVLKADPGCGKTTIAMLYGLTKLRKGDYDKMIITKPIIEVGTSMGYLPGTKEEKIEEYLASYYDVIDKIVGPQERDKLFKDERIMFKPIQFTRGKNMENSFIVFDEAQGCTLHESISFVTRMNDSSKMIILTDPFQADIKNSGIHDLLNILSNIDGVGIKELGEEFQMRSPLIQSIYKKYKDFLSDKVRR